MSRRKILKPALLAIACVAVFGAVYKIRQIYPLLKIAARYRAKMYCSCRALTGQSHEFCELWTHNPQVPKSMVPIAYDEKLQSVEAGTFLWAIGARYDAASQSCLLNQ